MVHQITDGLNAGEEMVYYNEQGNVVGLGYADEEEMLNGYDEQEGLYGAEEKDLIY